MRNATITHLSATGFVVVQSILASPLFAESMNQLDKFAWGDESRHLKIGIHIERANHYCTDLFVFSIAMANCSDQTIAVSRGSSWGDTFRPVYAMNNREKTRGVILEPPHLLMSTPMRHVPHRLVIELKPLECKVVHRSVFAPQIPSGEWSVSATLRVTEEGIEGGLLEEYKRQDVVTKLYANSGSVTINVEEDQQAQPGLDAAETKIDSETPCPLDAGK